MFECYSAIDGPILLPQATSFLALPNRWLQEAMFYETTVAPYKTVWCDDNEPYFDVDTDINLLGFRR